MYVCNWNFKLNIMAKTYQRTKLQKVVIRGYKSIAFDRPVTLELGDVSILLGANGAAKSNINRRRR